jgi:phenylalanyl-tRNA synthetase alpha chain
MPMADAAGVARLREEFRQALDEARDERALTSLRDRFLGRKAGAVATLMKEIAAAPPHDRPALGRLANDLKREIEEGLAARRAALETRRPAGPAIDVTLPGRQPAIGRSHPLTLVRRQIEDIFVRWGFEILDGPETEDDYHNFEALNMPADHPARDMQDTLYLAAPLTRRLWSAGRTRDEAGVATLLRTHTSSMQIRYMQTHQPPIRIISPGRVYRRDNLDMTHTPMFQQFECLVVGDGVTMADLKGTLIGFLRELFGPAARVLFRPSFFPYTEPSGDVFVSCWTCDGAGCAMCKRTGWIEVLGCGMVNPAVFEAVGYDPERYTGFAFGAGIERLALLKYGVEDIRLFYENDLRFLEQFPS